MITDINTRTSAGLRYELAGSACENVRVLHYYIRGVRLGEMTLPDMDAWLLVDADDDEAVFLVLLWPNDHRWPTHALSCGDTPKGDGIETAISAALDEYAARQPGLSADDAAPATCVIPEPSE